MPNQQLTLFKSDPNILFMKLLPFKEFKMSNGNE